MKEYGYETFKFQCKSTLSERVCEGVQRATAKPSGIMVLTRLSYTTSSFLSRTLFKRIKGALRLRVEDSAPLTPSQVPFFEGVLTCLLGFSFITGQLHRRGLPEGVQRRGLRPVTGKPWSLRRAKSPCQEAYLSYETREFCSYFQGLCGRPWTLRRLLS